MDQATKTHEIDYCPDMTATYSPQDNKLRLYSVNRLDSETYKHARDHGFRWAPKQGFFVAPMWTPDREDFLLSLCGHIEDETSTLEERAAARAARFEVYSEKREAEAERTTAAIRGNDDPNLPLGQRITITGNNRRKAEKKAAQKENLMRKAANLWEKSYYWEQRAKASMAHAAHKDSEGVRVGRIKRLEADKRKRERTIEKYSRSLKRWQAEDMSTEKAISLLDAFYWSPNDSSLYKKLESGEIDGRKAAEVMTGHIQRVIAWAQRWIAHFDNRIAYERAFLTAMTGHAEPQAATWEMAPGGTVKADKFCNDEIVTILRVTRKAGKVISLTVKGRWGNYKIQPHQIKEYTPPTPEKVEAVKKATKQPPLVNIPGGAREMTKDEWAKLHRDYKDTRYYPAQGEHGAYRRRWAMYYDNGRTASGLVYLTDQKEIPIPMKEAAPDLSAIAPQEIQKAEATPRPYVEDSRLAAAKALREGLVAGVTVAVADQLFPTPPAVADQVADLANIEPGHTILEPSAGTGNLIEAAIRAGADPDKIEAVEINYDLVNTLRHKYPQVRQANFLDHAKETGFDRIIMNPPFKNGEDMKHINHALTLLKPGGILVAICANGPRQQAKLKPLAEDSGGEYEPLPANTFDGTGVNTAILRIYKG